MKKHPIALRLGRQECKIHRLIKTQIGHAKDFAWYRGQRPSPARVILSHERVQIHASENLCSYYGYATNPSHFRVRELLLCDILITRAGDGRWPRYQAKSLACPGCGKNYLLLHSSFTFILECSVFPIQSSDVCSKTRLIRKTTCETLRGANATGAVRALSVTQASA